METISYEELIKTLNELDVNLEQKEIDYMVSKMYHNDLVRLRTAFLQELLSKAGETEANRIAEAQACDALEVDIENNNTRSAEPKAKIEVKEDAAPEIENSKSHKENKENKDYNNEQAVDEASGRDEFPAKESVEESILSLLANSSRRC